MRSKQLINPVFDCHFLRRWRLRLIVQTATADAEQARLGRERERVGVAFYERTALGMA